MWELGMEERSAGREEAGGKVGGKRGVFCCGLCFICFSILHMYI